MSAACTPWPWTARHDDLESTIHADGYRVANVHQYGGIGGDWQAMRKANASLIAAAPDMLASLEKMRDLLRKLQPALNVMARDVMDDIIRDQIDPAIAKARGAA